MSHLHDKVSALVDGELTGVARERAVAHARRCSDCRDEIVQTLALKRRLHGLPPAEPSEALSSTLESVNPVGDDDLRQHGAIVFRRMLISLGSVSAAVLAIAYVVGAPAPAHPQAVQPPVEGFSAEFADDAGVAPLADPAVGGLTTAFQQVSLSAGRQAPQPTYLQAPGLTAGSQPIQSEHGDDSRAVRLLHRAVLAPQRISYAGVRDVVSYAEGRDSTVQIAVQHSPTQGTSFDVRGAGMRRSEATFVAQTEAANNGLAQQPLQLLVRSYDISIGGSGVVAGRDASVVVAARNGATAARFWIDDATGLLMRKETYDGGRLVRSTSFVKVHTAHHGFLQHLPPVLAAPPATPVSMDTATALNDEGWSCPLTLRGRFVLGSLHQLGTRADVMHASYSDGLSSIGLFEQRGSLDHSALPGFVARHYGAGTTYLRPGLPTVAVWDSDSTVYTLVTDAPASTVKAVVATLPHETPPERTSAIDRVENGLGRIGSFFDPMG